MSVVIERHHHKPQEPILGNFRINELSAYLIVVILTSGIVLVKGGSLATAGVLVFVITFTWLALRSFSLDAHLPWWLRHGLSFKMPTVIIDE